MTPATVLRQLLVNLGLAEESEDWTAYVSFLPDVPDQAICVYDTAGKLDGRLMGSGEQIEHPGVQIRVRGKSYPDTWAKITEIMRSLDMVNKVYVDLDSEGTYIVHSVSRSGAIVPLGMDETGNRRHFHFTANMTLTLSRET